MDVISMDGVTYTREGRVILKDIRWQVRRGEHWAIIGLNGSGKTTLLNIVNGYIYPSAGDVRVLGRRFGQYDLRELRKSIGWVSSSLQERLYGNDTAVKIVLSGKFASIGLYDRTGEEDLDKAYRILERLGCRELADRQYRLLSQGEKQKVLIARALMSSPQLLILDEPCTGLDLFARDYMLKSIEEICQSAVPTVLYVTHRIEEVLPTFSHTLLLRRGEVYRAGKTGDVLRQDILGGFFERNVKLETDNRRYWLRISE